MNQWHVTAHHDTDQDEEISVAHEVEAIYSEQITYYHGSMYNFC